MKFGTHVRSLVDLDLGDNRKLRKGMIGTISEVDDVAISFPFRVSFPDAARATQMINPPVWMAADEIEPVELLPAPPEGMTSEALAEYVGEFIRQTQGRITGIGSEQYERAEGQVFEKLSLRELLQMAREEAQDLAVYAAMTDIKLARLMEMAERIGVAK